MFTTASTLLIHISHDIPVTGSISFTIGTLARVSAYTNTCLRYIDTRFITIRRSKTFVLPEHSGNDLIPNYPPALTKSLIC